MTVKQFLKTKNICKMMLRALGVIRSDECYIAIELTPEYEITPYNRQFGAYYFRNYWNFAEKYEYVISLEIESYRIFTEIDIDELSNDLQIPKLSGYGDHSRFLELVRARYPDALTSYGFPTDIDQFELQQLRILNIDNFSKHAAYEGSYQADAGEVDMDFFPLYAYLNIEAVPLVMENFYQNLLAEGYILFLQRNYKLSFFILYSALENFLKQTEAKPKGQVRQQLTKAFAWRFADAGNCVVYTHFKDVMEWADDFRNDIAHGKKYTEIGRVELEYFMYGVLAMICAYESASDNLGNLRSWLKKH